jgi:hypothetical protein
MRRALFTIVRLVVRMLGRRDEEILEFRWGPDSLVRAQCGE